MSHSGNGSLLGLSSGICRERKQLNPGPLSDLNFFTLKPSKAASYHELFPSKTLERPQNNKKQKLKRKAETRRPLPRSLAPRICGSGSSVCGERRSSTSCLGRSWPGSPRRTPTPEEHRHTQHTLRLCRVKVTSTTTEERQQHGRTLLPRPGWVLRSSDPRTSRPPTPSCGMAAGSCAAAARSRRRHRSTASGRWAAACR